MLSLSNEKLPEIEGSAFYAEWLSVAFPRAWAFGETAATVVSLVTLYLLKSHPNWGGEMNELGWQIPIGCVVLVLIARLAWAPLVMARKRESEYQHRAEVAEKTAHEALEREKRLGDKARKELGALQEFKVNFKHHNIVAVWSQEVGGERFDAPDNEMWLVVHGIKLTNRSDKRVPLEFRISVSSDGDSYRMSVPVGRPAVPPWAIEKVQHMWHELELLPETVELEGFGTHPNAFCGVKIPQRIAAELKLETAEALIKDRALWFEIHDRRTGSHIECPLNGPAHLAKVRQRRPGQIEGRIVFN